MLPLIEQGRVSPELYDQKIPRELVDGLRSSILDVTALAANRRIYLIADTELDQLVPRNPEELYRTARQMASMEWQLFQNPDRPGDIRKSVSPQDYDAATAALRIFHGRAKSFYREIFDFKLTTVGSALFYLGDGKDITAWKKWKWNPHQSDDYPENVAVNMVLDPVFGLTRITDLLYHLGNYPDTVK